MKKNKAANASGTNAGNPNGAKTAAKSGKYNVVDVAAVILILLAGAFILWRMIGSDNHEQDRNVHMTYRVLVEGAASEIYDTVQAHLPSQLMASGKMLDGNILSVERQDYLVLGPDGVWVSDPNHVNLIFTVENNSQTGDVLMSKVGEQEIRIGRKDYTLKTEYLEFHNTAILDIDWDITP